MEKSHRAPMTFLLAEFWLEIGSKKTHGEPSGLCPILSITATSNAKLAVGRTGQVWGAKLRGLLSYIWLSAFIHVTTKH